MQGDDQQITISSVNYSNATISFSTVNLATPLIDDTYRFVICDEIEDTSDEPLDGDHNGVIGGDFVTEFIMFPKPTNVTGTLGAGELTISWDDLATSETGYAIERRENISSTGWMEIAIIGDTRTGKSVLTE